MPSDHFNVAFGSFESEFGQPGRDVFHRDRLEPRSCCDKDRHELLGAEKGVYERVALGRAVDREGNPGVERDLFDADPIG